MTDRQIRRSVRRLSASFTESSRYQLCTPDESGSESRRQPEVSLEVTNESRWRPKSAPKGVIENMLGRLDEWATAKKNRIEAEEKEPCSGKCTYNGCSTTAMDPIDKHSKVVYVPDADGPPCFYGCKPKYVQREKVESRKEVNGILIHLGMQNAQKAQKKRKELFEKYCPHLNAKDRTRIGLEEELPLPTIDECADDMQKYIDERQAMLDSRKEQWKEDAKAMREALKAAEAAQERRNEERAEAVAAKLAEIQEFDRVRAEAKEEMKAQMKSNMRAMRDARHAYFEKLAAAEEKAHEEMMERRRGWMEVARVREEQLAELEAKRIETLREFGRAERARMAEDEERAAQYDETQWAKDLRQWGIDDRERKQKQEEERMESIAKQKQASKETAKEYQEKLKQIIEAKEEEAKQRRREERELIAAYEAARVERAESAKAALKAEREAVKQRAQEIEERLAERLANHSFVP